MNNKNNNGFLRNAFLYIIVIIAVVTGVQYFAGGSQSPSQQLSYTQLVKKIEDGKVKSITYQPDGSIIEVKGSGSLNPMRVNYFLCILGELLQRMDDPTARYSIALPDLKQFRNLWLRLPDLAKQRSTIDAIFVSEDGMIDFVK